MKHGLWRLLLLLAWSAGVVAGSTQYTLRVDGMACPFCAYGIEKKLKAITGIQHIDVDLDHGLVVVIGDDHVKLSNQQMTTLFRDAGFTFRSMEKTTREKKQP